MNNDSRERPRPLGTEDVRLATDEGRRLERIDIVRWLNERAAAYSKYRAQHNGPGGSGDLQNVIEGLAAAIERGSHRGPR